MANRPPPQTAAQRRSAQRKAARQLKAGENPLGGKFRRIVQKALDRDRRVRAEKHFNDELGHYWGFNKDTVREGCREVMTDAQVQWTLDADAEQIRDRASAGQRLGDPFVILWKGNERNPWWYH
jgi:hypothetical protein